MEKKRVLAAGKFDILHLGHLSYLEQARELAGPNGELVVIIARDDTITRERGAPPVFPQEQRRRLVEALDIVDKAIVGYNTDDHTLMVKDIEPDFIALGYDQRTDVEALEASFSERGYDTKIIRLEKRDADGLCSSTLIRSRIIEFYRENGRPNQD
ncbi:MAG: adenylyltransferase/cytidyltransferase family protein [Candidatus Thorarchaeota archaeon]|jgi:FAD synthetase